MTKDKPTPEAPAEGKPRVPRTTGRRYRRLLALKAAGGAAYGLGAGTIGLLFWWLKRLD
ncbi:hypothetical protein [Kitasatospora sp. A2-31]|uniref:hypothetical protein n=1 Tax=Kitasatospora sp. A2-31 TaxID=2916414 RepID=UPI001EEEA791|nr:hypothetical protein [Kitasatospora sp. A2-31]MCG6499609.1 hypothetical protein [Kitasatospora sp. A2-31]